MGLFDKKKSDDFNSPVERIDLSSVTAPTAASSATAAGRSQHAPAPAHHPVEPEQPRYGINQAIELMRTLPQDNVELVVQVVKRTLESTHIRIDTIIGDATRKQSDIEGRMTVLKQEIAELERDIASRRNEIAGLDADLKETTMVKERLVLAERPTPAPQPQAARSGILPAAGVTLPGLTSPTAAAGATSASGGATSPGATGAGGPRR